VRGGRGEQLFFDVDQVISLIVGQGELVLQLDGSGRAGLLAVTAEDAAAEVDLVHLGVALPLGVAFLLGVLAGLDINAAGRAIGRAEAAAHTQLQPVLSLQLVPPAETGVEANPFLRILNRDGLGEEIPEGDPHASENLV